MLFWNKICGLIFAFTLLCLSCRSQNTLPLYFPDNTFLLETVTCGDSTDDVTLRRPLLNINHLSPIIPPGFATCKYGFFCKQELIVEKAMRFPLRVRLGSLQQCNEYEGKRSYRF